MIFWLKVKKMANEEKDNIMLHTSISLGTVMAMVVSWSVNKSILWMLLHGFCGWLYIIYYALFISK